MRRRIPYRVCSCRPDGVVTHLEARLLRQLVNREIHPIRCAQSCRRKYLKGMRIGDLCAETGHFLWAMKIWGFTEEQIENKDWDEWRYVWFDNKRVRLTDVISETECELLSKRRSDLWRALGFPEESWWDEQRERYSRQCFGTYYTVLWAEKFDYYPWEIMEEYEKEMRKCQRKQETQQIFREGQGDNLPPCSQDFTEYWHDTHIEDFSWLDDKNERW